MNRRSSGGARSLRGLPLIALAISLVAIPGFLRLSVATDIVDLLPDGTPAVHDYRVFLETFGGLERVFVLVELSGGTLAPAEPSDPGASVAELACRLAEILEASAPFRGARCGLEPEDEAFFSRVVLERVPLLLDEEDLPELRERREVAALATRAREIRQALRSPAAIWQKEWLRHDPLGLASLLPGLPVAGGSLVSVDPVTGAFATTGHDLGLVIATPVASSLDATRGRQTAAAIEQASHTLREECGCPVSIQALGGPLYAVQDEASLRSDLRTTLTTSAAGCVLVLWLAFGSPTIPAIILLAILMALFWTASALGWLTGSISGVGLGFAAVLIGLGTDFGIHGAVRFRQSPGRFAGRTRLPVLYREVGPGILSAAATTAASFSVLGLAHFRPLRDVGLGVAVGMAAMLLATALLGPLVAFRPSTPPATPLWRFLDRIATGVSAAAAGSPRSTLGLALLVSVLALLGTSRLELDPDPSALRSTDHPAVRAERRLADAFGVRPVDLYLVVSASDTDTAMERSFQVEERIRERFPEARVDGLHHWFPPRSRAQDRLAALAAFELGAAADRLDEELAAAGLRASAFAPGLGALRALGLGVDPLGEDALQTAPVWASETIVLGPGETSLLLRVQPGAGGPSLDPDLVAASIAPLPGVAVASAGRLGSALRDLALSDLSRLGVAAFLVILLVVAVSFRGDVLSTLLALLPVTLGTLWTMGLWGVLSGRLDLLSIALLPVLFGVGVDDGLHTLHAARSQPAGSLLSALGEVGRALVLTSATTAIGFGSLGASSIPGLRNAGIIVALGVTSCLLATLTVLPAAAAIRGSDRRGSASREAAQGPPQAPSSGLMRRILGRYYVTGSFWYRFHLFGVSVLPERAIAPVLLLFTTFFFLALRRIRRAIDRNLSQVLGPAGWWQRQLRIFRTLHNFAWCLTERYERLGARREMVPELDGAETWRRLESSEQGFLVVTAHIGHWEIGSLLPDASRARTVHVVREREMDPDAQVFLRRLIEGGAGDRLRVHFAGESAVLGSHLLEALRSGDVVALQGDRPRVGGRTVDGELFGRPYPFPVGPFALARAAGVEVVPLFVYRAGRRTPRVEVRPPFRVAADGGRSLAFRLAAEHLAGEIERAIRLHPYQWYCFRDLWPR